METVPVLAKGKTITGHGPTCATTGRSVTPPRQPRCFSIRAIAAVSTQPRHSPDGYASSNAADSSDWEPIDIQRIAHLLVAQRGPLAIDYAADWLGSLCAVGDFAGCAEWSRILAELNRMHPVQRPAEMVR